LAFSRHFHARARRRRTARRILAERWTGPPAFCLTNSAAAVAAALWGSASPTGDRNSPDRVSAVCLLSDFGLAGWFSLSLGAWVPSAAPPFDRDLILHLASRSADNSGLFAVGAEGAIWTMSR